MMYICGQIGRRVPAVRLITRIGSKEEIKMSNAYPKKATTSGEVKISENVIRSIAGVAAKETEGVAELAELQRSFLLPAATPVSVSVVNDMVEITIRLVLMSGYRLSNVAEQVQQKVKDSVQSMTTVSRTGKRISVRFIFRVS